MLSLWLFTVCYLSSSPRNRYLIRNVAIFPGGYSRYCSKNSFGRIGYFLYRAQNSILVASLCLTSRCHWLCPDLSFSDVLRDCCDWPKKWRELQRHNVTWHYSICCTNPIMQKPTISTYALGEQLYCVWTGRHLGHWVLEEKNDCWVREVYYNQAEAKEPWLPGLATVAKEGKLSLTYRRFLCNW